MSMTKQQIQDTIGAEWEILFACQTGSQLFCSNPHDEDIMVVIKDYPHEYKKYNVDGTDLFCQSYDAFFKKATFCSTFPSLYALTWQFAKQGDTLICGEFPLKDWDWFDWQRQAVAEALSEGEKRYFHERIYGRDGVHCSKGMVWALAIYYAVKNGNLNYTPEQRETMQKCHDCELPKEQAYILQEQLRQLLQELDEVQNG